FVASVWLALFRCWVAQPPNANDPANTSIKSLFIGTHLFSRNNFRCCSWIPATQHGFPADPFPRGIKVLHTLPSDERPCCYCCSSACSSIVSMNRTTRHCSDCCDLGSRLTCESSGVTSLDLSNCEGISAASQSVSAAGITSSPLPWISNTGTRRLCNIPAGEAA